MSVVFEGVLTASTVEAVREICKNSNVLPISILRFLRLGVSLTIVVRQDPDGKERFISLMDEVAVQLSILFYKALVIRWDDQVGYRAAKFFINGELVNEFGAADEVWVLLDDEGNPVLGGQQFKVYELVGDENVEYATLKNAIQLGIEAFGEVSWKKLFNLM